MGLYNTASKAMISTTAVPAQYIKRTYVQSPPAPPKIIFYTTMFSTSFTCASASKLDLESEGLNNTTPLSSLAPAMTHTSWTAPVESIMDPLDHFGYTLFSSRTYESRHDCTQSIADLPPPYAEVADITLPEYTLYAPEPVTLAMFLFRFGFLFPPFWIFGVFILLSPLREPQNSFDGTLAWMPEKTEAERQQIIATIRKAELKWANRCLSALLVLLVVALGGGLTAWRIFRH